jgi:hypothetical protein
LACPGGPFAPFKAKFSSDLIALRDGIAAKAGEWREGVGVEPTRDVYSPILDLKAWDEQSHHIYYLNHRMVGFDRCGQIVTII